MVVPISSVYKPNRTLEGTRITLVKVPDQRQGVEFSIRTPGTPHRWEQYDEEMTAAWEKILDALMVEDHAAAAEHILQFAYYWYNFMPVARGTAAVGYTMLLGAFWAAGMPVNASIPRDYQVGRGGTSSVFVTLGQYSGMVVLGRMVSFWSLLGRIVSFWSLLGRISFGQIIHQMLCI